MRLINYISLSISKIRAKLSI